MGEGGRRPDEGSYFSKATMRQAVLPWNIGYLTFALQAFRDRFFASARESNSHTVPQPCAIPTVRVSAIAFQPLAFFHRRMSCKQSVLSDLIPKLAGPASELELDPIASVATTKPSAKHLDACMHVLHFIVLCPPTGTRSRAAAAPRSAWRGAHWVRCR